MSFFHWTSPALSQIPAQLFPCRKLRDSNESKLGKMDWHKMQQKSEETFPSKLEKIALANMDLNVRLLQWDLQAQP